MIHTGWLIVTVVLIIFATMGSFIGSAFKDINDVWGRRNRENFENSKKWLKLVEKNRKDWNKKVTAGKYEYFKLKYEIDHKAVKAKILEIADYFKSLTKHTDKSDTDDKEEM